MLTKIPIFGHFILLNGMSFVFWRLINTFFAFFGCWFLQEKSSVCPKNDGFV